MRKELDEALCKKYPKIFRDRHGNMRDTAIWGFGCGDGWYDILDKACSLIQRHIDYTRAQRARALRYNRALHHAVRGDVRPLQKHFTFDKYATEPSEYGIKKAAEVLEDIEPQCKRVPEACPQVVATQIKEKFGTLRFYYYGGDNYCRGVESMAESMSAVTCEVCGSSGKLRNGGWIRTLCDEHAKEAGYEDFGLTHG